MELQTFSNILWHQRDLLEILRYRLEIQELVLHAGLTSHLPLATREVEETVEKLRTAELGRSIDASAAARSLDLAADATLREIAEAAPAPWDELLREHHAALVELTSDISTVSRRNRDTLAASYQATQETLSALREDVRTYDKHGGTAEQPSDSHIIDTSL